MIFCVINHCVPRFLPSGKFMFIDRSKVQKFLKCKVIPICNYTLLPIMLIYDFVQLQIIDSALTLRGQISSCRVREHKVKANSKHLLRLRAVKFFVQIFLNYLYPEIILIEHNSFVYFSWIVKNVLLFENRYSVLYNHRYSIMSQSS